MSLQTIFISHAKPENNDFVRWLSARLTGEGYKVWAELLDSTGGSPFWADIEVAIREHTVKFISVVSKESVTPDRRGFRNELSIADARGRTLKDARFIIPIRLDEVTQRRSSRWVTGRLRMWLISRASQVLPDPPLPKMSIR
jgi:hypothetical protein